LKPYINCLTDEST